MLTFFRKENIQKFFFVGSDISPTPYLNLFLKKDNNFFWKKLDVLKKNTQHNNINEQNKSNTIFLYKPDSLITKPNAYECFFLRKTKSFNKGRYSRNRQVYRTGVYICFYVNVIAVCLLWFYFYKFKFKFTYYWWFFILLPFSFIYSRALKYDLFNPRNFYFHFSSYINWFLFFFKK